MLNNQRRAPGIGVYLLVYHLLGIVDIGYIPPVTLATIITIMAIYVRAIALPWENIDEVCISSEFVFKHREWKRLIFGALEHGDDFHLYYNMVSFIFKGQTLEKHFGTALYLYILSVFTVLTSFTLCVLCFFTGAIINDFGRQCALGFSGVIFALKVLTTHHYPPINISVRTMPVLVPGKWISWFELILIQVITPNVSFLGHLAGILVGIAYVNGPLKFIMHDMFSIAFSYLPFNDEESETALSEGEMVSRRQNVNNESSNFQRDMRNYDQLRRETLNIWLEKFRNRYWTARKTSTNNENYLPHSSHQSNSDTRHSTYEEFYPYDSSDEEHLRLSTESSLRENFNYSRTNPSSPELDDSEFYYTDEFRSPPHEFHSLPSHLYSDLNNKPSRRMQHFTL